MGVGGAVFGLLGVNYSGWGVARSDCFGSCPTVVLKVGLDWGLLED